MPLTDKLSVVGQGIYSLIDSHKNDAGIALKELYYGDQQLIDKVPAVAVETSSMTRELGGIGGKGPTNNVFTVYLICYLSKLQSIQATRLQVEQLVEKLVDVLHLDVTLGGLITHGHVIGIESGYATRQSTTFKVVKITWQGKNKTIIV